MVEGALDRYDAQVAPVLPGQVELVDTAGQPQLEPGEKAGEALMALTAPVPLVAAELLGLAMGLVEGRNWRGPTEDRVCPRGLHEETAGSPTLVEMAELAVFE